MAGNGFYYVTAMTQALKHLTTTGTWVPDVFYRRSQTTSDRIKLRFCRRREVTDATTHRERSVVDRIQIGRGESTEALSGQRIFMGQMSIGPSQAKEPEGSNDFRRVSIKAENFQAGDQIADRRILWLFKYGPHPGLVPMARTELNAVHSRN